MVSFFLKALAWAQRLPHALTPRLPSLGPLSGRAPNFTAAIGEFELCQLERKAVL